MRRFFAYFLLICITGLLAYTVSRYVFQNPKSFGSATTPEKTANLAYYVEAQRLDPIFALEGTDPGALRAAVQSLFDEKDLIAKLYSKEQGSIIENALYPRTFLKLLPDLETARQTLLAHPSVVNAKKYHTLLLEATHQYILGAQALSANLSIVSAKIPQLGFLGGKASTTGMAEKILSVADVGVAQGNKEEARFSCFEHMTSDCPSLTTLKQTLLAQLQHTENIPAPTAAITKAGTLSRRILSIIPNFYSISNTAFGFTSSCFGSAYGYQSPYYLHQVPGQPARKADTLNNLYFYDVPVEAKHSPTVPLYKKMLDAGVTLHYQSIGNLYMCPDSGLDAFSVGSILGTLDSIASTAPQTDTEEKLLSLPFVQKNDLADYVREKAESGSPQGVALAQRFIEGSANFDQVVMGAYNDNHFLVTWDKKQAPVQFEYMIINRNFASLLFFMGNPTFVPQKISLLSDTTPNRPSKMELREYINDVSKQFSDDAIVEMVRAAIRVDLDNFNVKE